MILRTVADCDRFALACKAMVANGPVEVDPKAWKPRRSDQQNRALWGVAYKALRDATGNDADDLHTFFLGEYFGWEVVEVMGQARRVPMRRSSRLNKTEFAEYVAFCQQKGAEHGIYIPDPES